MPVEDGADVVGVHVAEVEADRAAAGRAVARAEDRHVADLVEHLEQVSGEGALVRMDGGTADAVQVVAGGLEPHDTRDVGRPRLELVRHRVPRGALECHARDHAAAAEERWHALEQLRARPEHADAHGGAHLVSAERDEVAAQLANRHGHVRHRLRGVDADQSPGGVGSLRDAPDVVDRSQHVGLMAEADELGWRAEELVEPGEVEATVVGDVQEGKLETCAVRGQLPRNEIAVVLHDAEHDAITGREQLACVRGRDEVQPLGRVTHKDEAFGRCIDELRHAAARVLEEIGRFAGEGVHAAVHVGVAGPVVAFDRVENLHRLL